MTFARFSRRSTIRWGSTPGIAKEVAQNFQTSGLEAPAPSLSALKCVCVWGGGGAGEAQAFPGAFSFRSICDYLEIQKIKGLLLSRLNIRV